MKITTVLILAAAALALGLLVLFSSRSTSSPPPGLTDWNTPLLQGVNLTGLSAVTVSDSTKTVSLALSNGIWRVRNRYDYPADTAKLRSLLDTLRNATRLETIDIEPGNLGDLGLAPEQGTRLELSNAAAGKTLFALTAGTVHQKQSDDPNMAMFGGFPDGRYLLLDSSACLASDTLDILDDGPALWLDKDFLRIPASELISLSIEGPGREPIRLTRNPTNPEWKLDGGLPAGKTLDSDRLARLTSAFESLSFEDLGDPRASDSETGLSTGIVCSATATNGIVYDLQLGNSAETEKRRYARVTLRGPDPLPEQATRLSRQFSPWIYTMDDSVIEPLLFTRDQLASEPQKTKGTP